MKNKKVMACLLAMSLACSMSMMTGCGGTDDAGKGAKDNTKQEQQQNGDVLTFVAADKTNWDKEVALGGYGFKLALHLNEDNTLTLEGTCVGEAKEEQGMMGPGGGMPDGDMGDGMPGGDAAGGEDEAPGGETNAAPGGDEVKAPNGNEAGAPADGGEGVQANEPAEDKVDDKSSGSGDFSQYDFEISGTWEYETGWGYTLMFEDENNTTITANFDKASSRQYFYYDMELTIGGAKAEKTQVQFQAEDRNFRSEMAEDYTTAEERNAKYIFEGKGNSATGNAVKTQVYCQENKTVAVITMSGSNTTYSTGTWEEDEETHKMTITMDGEEMTAYYSQTAGKEGYCLLVTASGGSGPASYLLCYCPLTEGVNASDFSEADFPEAAAELEGLSSQQSGPMF